MTNQSADKFDSLLSRLRDFKRVVVAFSGGLDSGFVLYAANEALGSLNVLAVTGDSDSLSRDDLKYAREFVSTLGLEENHRIIMTRELDDPNYAANGPDRCFFCKQRLYTMLKGIASTEGFDAVLDGCNASDIGDHRPGRNAAAQHGIVSPLLEANLSKAEIRDIAKSKGLAIWDKPQAACLASRIPYGETVTAEKLAMVEKAETYLREMGFRQMRVRNHGKIARIELEEKDIDRILSPEVRLTILAHLKDIGFLWVAVDLKPFKSGSMNVMIKEGNRE